MSLTSLTLPPNVGTFVGLAASTMVASLPGATVEGAMLPISWDSVASNEPVNPAARHRNAAVWVSAEAGIASATAGMSASSATTKTRARRAVVGFMSNFPYLLTETDDRT